MTCASNTSGQFRPPHKETGKIPNVIENLFSVHQHSFLLKLIHESISAISEIFFNGRYTTELTALHKKVSGMSHIELLAVFFLLLNVDQTLKKHIMAIEIVQNHRKLERFFLDLRRTIVVQFSINESISITKFVEQCEEFYVLA